MENKSFFFFVAQLSLVTIRSCQFKLSLQVLQGTRTQSHTFRAEAAPASNCESQSISVQTACGTCAETQDDSNYSFTSFWICKQKELRGLLDDDEDPWCRLISPGLTCHCILGFWRFGVAV